MKVQSVIALVALALCAVSATGIHKRKVSFRIPSGHPLLNLEHGLTSNANILVDAVMAKLRDVIAEKNLDPLPLANKEWSFLGITVTFVGQISGLSTIHRTADADLSFDDQGEAILSMEIGCLGVVGAAELEAKSIFFDQKGDAEADIGELHAQLTAVGSSLTGPFAVTEYHTDDIEDFTVVVTGFGTLLDEIIDELATAIAGEFKYQIFNALDSTVKDEINQILGALTVSFNKAPLPYQRRH